MHNDFFPGIKYRPYFLIAENLLNSFQFLLCHFRLVRLWKSFDVPSEKISDICPVTQFQKGEGLFE
jgi:hypothetical protein